MRLKLSLFRSRRFRIFGVGRKTFLTCGSEPCRFSSDRFRRGLWVDFLRLQIQRVAEFVNDSSSLLAGSPMWIVYRTVWKGLLSNQEPKTLLRVGERMMESIVFERIEGALALFQRHEKRLRTVPEIKRLLVSLSSAIEKTQETMERTGVIRTCSGCAEQTGSCCFQEVETWYDPMLLLVNLLLAGDIPRSREFPNQCLFLGERGCRLRSRYAFCLNYFCPTLKRKLGPGLLGSALTAVGHELAVGWDLEQALYRWLRIHRPL